MKKSTIYLLLLNIVFAINCQAQLYDNTFNGTGVWNTEVHSQVNQLKALSLQSNGYILFSGTSKDSASAAISQFLVARLDTTGVLDNAFDSDGIAQYTFSTDNYNSADDIIFSNNQIFASGYRNNSGTFENLLVKLNTTGGLDVSLNSTGYLTSTINGSPQNITYSIHATTDNKVIALGYSYNTQSNLSGYRVDESGNFDNSFGTNGKIFYSTFGEPIVKSCIQSDNKLLTYDNGSLLRIKTNGDLDSTTFGINGQVSLNVGANGAIVDIAVQKDGKIVLCGNDENSNFSLYRFNSDGSIDNTFGTSGKITVSFGGTLQYAKAITIDTTSITGDIFAVGYSIYPPANNTYFALARISSVDGSIEATAEFKPNSFTAIPEDIVLQKDGKIIIGGSSYGYTIDDFIITRIVPNFATLIATSVEDASNVSNSFNLFPNPASQSVTVNSIYNIQQIKVLDVLGNEVLTQTANGNTQINVSAFPKGLYNFVITTDKGTGSKKVSVQ